MATREGGGLYLSGTGTGGSDKVINNTFYGNGAGTSSTMSLLDGATVLFKNNIVPDNTIKTEAGTTFNYGNNAIGSITAAGTVNDLGGNITTAVNPVYTSMIFYAGTDGKYFTADDGYNLKSTNPVAINDGGTLIDAPSVDITGAARSNANRPTGSISMGAFEKQ